MSYSITLHKILLTFALLVPAFVLISCNSGAKNTSADTKGTSDSISQSSSANPALDSIVEYLVNASAKDFVDHQPPIPVRFRNVQLKNLTGSASGDHFLLCGEFLAKDKQDKGDWTYFATIKTSGYEQWIGGQSIGYCQDAKPVAYKLTDVSALLQSRVDSLQTLKGSGK